MVSTAQALDRPDLSHVPKYSVVEGNGDAALIISIGDYPLPYVPGASSNGQAWSKWLAEGQRVPVIKSLTGADATSAAILRDAEAVATLVQPGGRMWLIFIGHGAISPTSGEGLLLGVDADPDANSVGDQGLGRGALMASIEQRLPDGAALIMVIDASFGGLVGGQKRQSGQEAPIEKVVAPGPRATVLSAAGAEQIVGLLPDGSRPTFSYLVLGALRGWGDLDSDGNVTASEAVRYSEQVLAQMGSTQTPTLQGPDLILGRSGGERAPALSAVTLSGLPPLTAPTFTGPPLPELDDMTRMAEESREELAEAVQIVQAQMAEIPLQIETQTALDQAMREQHSGTGSTTKPDDAEEGRSGLGFLLGSAPSIAGAIVSYRRALDSYAVYQASADPAAMEELYTTANRQFITGHLLMGAGVSSITVGFLRLRGSF